MAAPIHVSAFDRLPFFDSATQSPHRVPLTQHLTFDNVLNILSIVQEHMIDLLLFALNTSLVVSHLDLCHCLSRL